MRKRPGRLPSPQTPAPRRARSATAGGGRERPADLVHLRGAQLGDPLGQVDLLGQEGVVEAEHAGRQHPVGLIDLDRGTSPRRALLWPPPRRAAVAPPLRMSAPSPRGCPTHRRCRRASKSRAAVTSHRPRPLRALSPAPATSPWRSSAPILPPPVPGSRLLAHRRNRDRLWFILRRGERPRRKHPRYAERSRRNRPR